ncbi:MAG: cation-binding protein [Parvularcula sp.]|nr:cation-binding protein [Parvularcula sp.]
MTAPNTTDVHSFSGKGDNKRTGDNPWAIEPMPAGLIDSPLDFIFAEHHRQREAASILTLLADGEFDLKGVKSLLAFLETDFALHIGDEELALFPMLREHCLPEDNVERILARLVDEHREDEASLETATAILVKGVSDKQLGVNDKRRLRMFAEHIRQHLALENGVLLPIARVRLRENELGILADLLKARRL